MGWIKVESFRLGSRGISYNELTHFVFPFLIDGTFHYESGMYAAALPLIPAAFDLRLILTEVFHNKAAVAA